jgi:hypothetical protein
MDVNPVNVLMTVVPMMVLQTLKILIAISRWYRDFQNHVARSMESMPAVQGCFALHLTDE